MKKIRIIILFLIIALIITFLALVFLKKDENKNINEEMLVSDSEVDGEYEDITDVQPVTSRINYYTIKNIVNKYYNNINKGNYDVLYNYLSKQYMQEFSVDKTSLEDKFTKIGTNYNIQDMYVLGSLDNNSIYLVKTIVDGSKDNLIMVTMDISNNTFEIFPDEYVRKYSNNKLDTTNILKNTKIELNNNNTFSLEFVNDEEMAKNYLKDFKQYIKDNNYKKIYEMLDEDYKKAKFKDYDAFEEYMKSNYERMSKAFLDMYNVTNYDDYTQYICIDSKENYYVFNETAIMKYTIILDNYTLNLPHDVKEYENLKGPEKATLSIKKYLRAIEDTDYKYAYGKLSKDFRNKYYETQEDFIKYISENKIESKTIKEVTVKEQDGLYVCTIQPKDDNIDYSDKKFIVQLDEGTDFKIAFTVN